MEKTNCPNRNHGSMNVTVRFCPDCGKVVNPRISAPKCTKDVHSKKRRERKIYCADCGERLR